MFTETNADLVQFALTVLVSAVTAWITARLAFRSKQREWEAAELKELQRRVGTLLALYTGADMLGPNELRAAALADAAYLHEHTDGVLRELSAQILGRIKDRDEAGTLDAIMEISDVLNAEASPGSRSGLRAWRQKRKSRRR